MATVIATSDLHGLLPEIPPCDLLLIGGDVTPLRVHEPIGQAAWLQGPFSEWVDQPHIKNVVLVAGNHDWVFERAPGLVVLPKRVTYLFDSGTVIDGLKVWGSPWQPPFCDWAFNAGEARRAAAWRLVPDDTDVLVLHGPPYGFGDRVSHPRPGEDPCVGCKLLLERIQEVSPRLTVFGHIHSGYGRWETPFGILANVSYVDERYQAHNAPMRFDLDPIGVRDR